LGNKVKVSHKTTYFYDRPVNLGPQLIRLKPAAHARTKVLSYSLQISPENHFINWIQDPYGNFQARVLFPEKISHFEINVDLGADLTVFNPFDFFLEPDSQELPILWTPELKRDLRPYFETNPLGEQLGDYLQNLSPVEGNTIDYLVGLNQQLSSDIFYNIRMEPNVQSSEDTLRLRSGSCRDSSLLLMEILRHQGFPARFVSGYLIQLKPDLKPVSGAQGAEEDFTDLHAWTEVYIPGAGWIGLDPTSGLFSGEGHIPLAATPWPSGAAPIEGSLDPCEVSFHYEMQVRRLNNQPRSTQPFPEEPNTESASKPSPHSDSDSRDSAIFELHPGVHKLLELGETVDQRLRKAGYILTIGGEPSFISDTDRNEAEWNGDALGPTKKGLSQKLLRRLAAKWAPGAVHHSSQGKWYPGESLPRWSLSCFWRKDGKPFWQKSELLALEEEDYGYSHENAKTFIHALVTELGVNSDFIIEAFEDPIHFLAKERDLPLNVTPGDPKLANPEDRYRMVQVFQRGLDQSTGYVLPIQRGSWKSGPWPLRSGRLVLIPGDSPIGLRLPLDSLPWAKDGENVPFYEADPMGYSPSMSRSGNPTTSSRLSFPEVSEKQKNQRKQTSPSQFDPTEQKTQEQPLPSTAPPLVEGESAAWVVRTALCVQAREGKLYLFMPPTRKAEDWFALVKEIEATCIKTGLKVILEGYTPAYSDDHLWFQITPDPGVIEVNLPPVDNTQDLHRLLDDLWREGREIGLSTIKYLIGGQEVGSGGGCHWVLGGPTPSQSPFILRPDLLRSWIITLNHHPSLSYLFSGLFVGATSQAPRFDEANPQLLEDMELAFQEVDHTQEITPWLTDRIFRNLLVDGTGNTHRTELCIDKLYSPDRPGGRLGLVEFSIF
jgi:transglutaminase-like putative cysteine protease